MIRVGSRNGLVSAGVLLSALAMLVGGTPSALAAGDARVGASARLVASGSAPQTTHTAVRIVVPPMAVILVNGNGSPVAVETNSNRSPRRGDTFYTTDSRRSEDLNKATPAQTDQVLRTLSPTAVWQPGWHYIGRR
jgi:hypothetical protein